MASGYLTSIVIVLIVVFLFREGAGLFDSPAVEQGYVLAVNRANPVQSLTPEQIMQIFDADLTNWSEVGGPDDSILGLPARRHHELRDRAGARSRPEPRAAMSEPDRGRSSEHDRLSARTVRRPRLRRQGSRRRTDHAGELFRRAAVVSDRRAGPAVRSDSAAGRHAVGQSGGHPDRIAAGAFRRHLHGRAGRLAAAPDAETRDRAAGRHSVGRLRILRARRGRAAGTRRLRPAGRRDGTRRQPDSGNHGAADDHHRRRGYDPHDSPSHARIESGARRDALQTIRRSCCRTRPRASPRRPCWHRPRGRRNDGPC